MRITCLGHITYDTIFPINKFPKENTKVRFYEKELCAGGPASIAAFLLGKWGKRPMIAGVVGNDNYGRLIKRMFEINNVDVKNLQLLPSAETSQSFVLSNKKQGSRTVYSYVSKNNKMRPFKVETDIILIDGHEFEMSKEILKQNPKAISVIDAGRSKKGVVELAKLVDYVVCSKNFAEEVTGIKINFDDKTTLAKVYRKMEKIFKGTIIITLESKGCLYCLDGKLKLMSSLKVKTVDSTGAGDIFHGAFVYGLAQNFDLEKNLKYSTIASALSVTKVGAYKSIPTLKETELVYNEIG